MNIKHDDKTFRANYFRGTLRAWIPDLRWTALIVVVLLFLGGTCFRGGIRSQMQRSYPLLHREVVIKEFRLLPVGSWSSPQPFVVFDLDGKEYTGYQFTYNLSIGQKVKVFYRDSAEYGIVVDHIELISPSP